MINLEIFEQRERKRRKKWDKIGKDRQTHPSFLRRPLEMISTSSIFIIIVSKFARCPLGPGVTLNALSDYAASLLHFLSKFCNTQCSLCNAFSVQGLKKLSCSSNINHLFWRFMENLKWLLTSKELFAPWGPIIFVYMGQIPQDENVGQNVALFFKKKTLVWPNLIRRIWFF